jgi:hypothetical protein
VAESKSTRRRSGGGGLSQSGAEVSAAVRKAANVLEKELQSSLAGVRRLESQFTKDRRVDERAFEELLERFRGNAHAFIDIAASRVADLRSDDVQDLSRRLTADTHELFDAMISMVGMAPDAINRIAAGADEVLPAAKGTKPTRTTTRSAARRPHAAPRSS